MNLGSTMILEGFNAQLVTDSVTFSVVNPGTRYQGTVKGGPLTFVGILEPITDVDVASELGSDLREISFLHAKRTTVTELLLKDDRVTDDTGATWKIAKRTDNPADPIVKFWVIVVITGKDK